MDDEHEKYMKRCYELAISAGKKGYDSFGAVLVHNGEILEEAENTADYVHRIFGHAEFNLVHKCANKYSDEIYQLRTLRTVSGGHRVTWGASDRVRRVLQRVLQATAI